MKVRLVIDSTVNIAENIKSRFTVVPLSLHFGEEDYIDGVTITNKEFYEKLMNSTILPTTSQPTPAAFAEIYKQAQAAGEEVVVLTIASKLSGTYQSASIAAMDFPENMIYVVDSQSVTIGTGILAEMAVSLADSGMSAAQIAAHLTQERENIRVIAALDTLEYLKRGGRISKTVAFAGGLLSIKPIINIKDGEIKMVNKARGSRQVNGTLMQEIKNAGNIDFKKPVLFGYTGLTDTALQKYLEDSSSFLEGKLTEVHTAAIGSVVGTHAGPDAVAIAFFSNYE